ncbi:MAG TPA: hypothetical protein VGF92_08365 [Stellaceae bacterium]|jgi:hypothetical protein
MLLEQFSRFFLRHEFVIRSYRNQGPPLKLRTEDDELDAFSLFASAVNDLKAQLPLQNGDAVRLISVEAYPPNKPVALVFLFRRANANVGAPWFEHQTTRALRRSDKKSDESVTVTAHLVVSLKSLHDGTPIHPAIIEEVPGLGRTYMQTEKTVKLLNKINVWRKEREWKDVRVSLDLPNERSKLVSIAREADAADVLFVRSERVVFQKPLDDATDKINEELVRKAVAKFSPAQWAPER